MKARRSFSKSPIFNPLGPSKKKTYMGFLFNCHSPVSSKTIANQINFLEQLKSNPIWIKIIIENPTQNIKILVWDFFPCLLLSMSEPSGCVTDGDSIREDYAIHNISSVWCVGIASIMPTHHTSKKQWHHHLHHVAILQIGDAIDFQFR